MRGRRGFTLVEMLVTASMLVIIVTAAFAVFGAGIRSATKTRRCGAMLSHGQMALRAIAEDIRAAIAHGDIKFTSLDVIYEGRACDTLDFTIVRPNPIRRMPEEGSRAEVGYYIDNDLDTEAEWLLRREDRTLDDDPRSGGEQSLVGPFVRQLNFEFFDGTFWQAGWDEDQDALPLAVRVEIEVIDEDEIEKPMFFRTTVPIMAR